MTREERELAIEELQGYIIAEEHGKDGKPNGNVTCELTKGTIDLAIKALEQEPVIDKVRAEIEKLQTYKMFIGEKTVYVERDDVLAIIDKYRGESEGTDAGSN